MISFEVTDTLQKAVLSCRGSFKGTALVSANNSVSYREFDLISDHIAGYLTAEGIGPGKVVALTMRRSEKMITAIYGIFKTGACLLPIPADIPQKRRDMILQDVEISMELTDETYKAALEEDIAGDLKFSPAAPEDNALILYTSGSTGKPKGVCHSQASKLFSKDQFPLHVLETGIPGCGINTIIAKTGVNFISAYIFEILAAPLSGRTLVILNDDEQNSPKAVARAISKNHDTSVFITPSQMQSFLKDECFAEAFKGLGTLILAGELLKPGARETILEYADDKTAVINLYGSSECHLISASDVRSDDYRYTEPLKDVETVIVDEDKNMCAPGREGELAVNSPCVFSHYTNADAGTVNINGKKYFRTGDMAAVSDTGKIWIKGRKDRMIKYHGLRIELSDIENNILRYPGIKECAVVLNMTEGGSQVLCAYYVSDTVTDTAKLRKFLSDYLPGNIIPVGMVKLDMLPLNANMKTDYIALSDKVFVPENADSGDCSKALSTDNERVLASVLQTIWENAAVSPSSNLFALGLDSLTAFRLIGELKERGYEIGISQIFAHPVLGELADMLKPCEKAAWDEENAEAVLPATGVQMYWGTDITPEKKARGMYVTSSFVCEKDYTENDFKARVELIVKKHPSIRAKIVFENEMPGQIISDDATVLTSFEDIRDKRKAADDPFKLSSDQEEYVKTVCRSLFEGVIGSEDVVALQAACFKISDKACLIMCTGNHLSVDGSSMNILMREFAADQLCEEPDSYTDFLRYIGKKSSMEEAALFWQEYLKDADFSTLPAVGEAGEKKEDVPPDFKGITIRLTDEDTGRLEEKCRSMGVSTVGFIMYLYGRSLMKILKKDAIIYQMLTFGRGVPVSGLDSSVGCFIEYVPIVVRDGESPADFQTGYLQAEQYSYLPPPVIWKRALGLDEPPELAPFLISEIFPPVRTKGYFKEIKDRDYAAMVMSNFVVMEEGHITLYFHYDAAKTDEETFTGLTGELERALFEECGKG